MGIQRFVCLFAVCSCSVAANEWPGNLWLGRGDIWHSRFAVTITNPSESALEGTPVDLTVGTGDGQAPLTGARAEAVRVTDGKGVQLLFGLRTPDEGHLFSTGAIPAGAALILPAVCGPKETATYTVYFDNPRAWALADAFEKTPMSGLNGDFEKGTHDRPLGWQTSMTTAQHRLSWSSEQPFSGQRCLKAEADTDAEKSWFGFVRSDFDVVPGARCTLRVRVRGEQVKGSAGWYVHVGDAKNDQRINQVARAGEGTFGWKEITVSFTVPDGATRMRTGSVLYGTGKAWYDDFRFETDKQPARATARAGAVERLTLSECGANAAWPETSPSEPRWHHRLPVRIFNLSDHAVSNILASADLNDAARGIVAPRYLLTLNGKPHEACRIGDRLLFSCEAAARTAVTYYLYVADSGRKQAAEKPSSSRQGSDIPSDQILAESPRDTDVQAFAALMNSPVNLIKNPDFERGSNASPDVWTHSAADADVTFALASPGGFGKRCASFTVSPTAKETWRGWYQSVSVTPGHSYLFGAWLACENLAGTAKLQAHLRNAQGVVAPSGFLGAGAPISGNTGWTPMFGTVTIPPNVAQFQMHLTMNDRGTLKHDGAFLAECLETVIGEPETHPLAPAALEAWAVSPVVKVFHETLPSDKQTPLAISLARNEGEALQIALRSGHDIPHLRVEVDAPTRWWRHSLTNFSVGWVGYVPIDHRTAYYNVTTPPWQLKYPTGTGSSDGWSGWWPDPIRPSADGSLAANQTQAIWITFKTATDTRTGRYSGKIRLLDGNTVIAKLPFTVTVWGFTLPETPSCPAIFDLRLSKQWLEGTTADAQRERMMRFMAERKVCPDGIDVSPVFKRDAQGKITADFTAYDQAARHYFGDLKFPTSYTPGFFYLFGWEHPPKNVLGEKPFEGEYPYKDADRSHLRAAYKEAYQTCLRLYWDHVKAQGWSDRLVLYISDEPFLTKKHIIDQMKACCTMIHEIDPKIRIYSSTWRHCPDWNGYLNIWGAGHYGCFAAAEMQARRAAGEHIWFTTDGQMCTDTPFCAVERLLPHYCFKYGAEAYEFWGISWLTYDPWRFGWHSYIYQSSTPGESYYVRYPNGDGFLLYPGRPVGVDGPVATVRIEAARDGVEDYEYLKALKAHANDPEATRILNAFGALIEIPNAGGRFSTKILPDPDRLTELRLQAGAWLDAHSR